MKYDLHTHTCLSDGELDVLGNANRAKELGLDGIAITDHDNIESWEVIDKGTFAVDVIKGVEISTFHDGESIHVLGYYKNDNGDYSELKSFLEMLRKKRKERIMKMIELLKPFDIVLEYEDIIKFADGAVGRPHVAKAIMEKYPDRNYTINGIFAQYIGNDKPAYVKTYNLDTVDAIKLLHDNHCIAVLAHPLLINPVKCKYKSLMEYPFDGIEVYYPYQTGSKSYKTVLNFAKKKNLMITGGSDYHGPNVRNTMGKAFLPDEELDIFLSLINKNKKN